MEMLPLYSEASGGLPAWPASDQGRRELQPQEMSALLTAAKRRRVTEEEIELIEMRYQQALALTNLEDLFAEGRLDRQ